MTDRHLAQDEIDPRIQLRVFQRITAEEQQRALKFAELWISGLTLVQIGEEFGHTAQQIGQFMRKHGSYSWAAGVRKQRAKEWARRHPPKVVPQPPPPPPTSEECLKRGGPRYGWRTGLSEWGLVLAEDAAAQAEQAYVADQRVNQYG